jgi:hypothetical protein
MSGVTSSAGAGLDDGVDVGVGVGDTTTEGVGDAVALCPLDDPHASKSDATTIMSGARLITQAF